MISQLISASLITSFCYFIFKFINVTAFFEDFIKAANGGETESESLLEIFLKEPPVKPFKFNEGEIKEWINFLTTVSTHNKHIFVWPKKVCLL